MTAGYPYEGRPEIRRGDNLSAMGPTPSLLPYSGGPVPAGGNGGVAATVQQRRPAEMV